MTCQLANFMGRIFVTAIENTTLLACLLDSSLRKKIDTRGWCAYSIQVYEAICAGPQNGDMTLVRDFLSRNGVTWNRNSKIADAIVENCNLRSLSVAVTRRVRYAAMYPNLVGNEKSSEFLKKVDEIDG